MKLVANHKLSEFTLERIQPAELGYLRMALRLATTHASHPSDREAFSFIDSQLYSDSDEAKNKTFEKYPPSSR